MKSSLSSIYLLIKAKISPFCTSLYNMLVITLVLAGFAYSQQFDQLLKNIFMNNFLNPLVFYLTIETTFGA